MAYRKDDDQSFEYSGYPKAAVLNRSFSVRNHKSNPSLSPFEYSKKPLSVERIGSFKRNDYSSHGSTVAAGSSLRGKVKMLCSIFEKPPPNSPLQSHTSSSSAASPKPSKVLNSDYSLTSPGSFPLRLPGTEDRVVIYFTSLRGIRNTYADCYSVRMIFKAYRVNLDEKDLSMDSAYKKELQSILGEKIVSLPQVFIKGKHVGGADVVRQLNEAGELRKMLNGLPIRASKPGLGYVCEGCGDVRFVPCSNCNGSRKVFDDDDEQLKRCLECNENGLVRCPGCCF